VGELWGKGIGLMDETSIATQLFNHSHRLYQLIIKYLNRRNMSVSYMTQEGYDKLRTDLEDLKTRGRQEVARAIAEAKEKGDLSENAEYDAAKDAQGMLELKINEMEKALANARIISETDLDASKVTILSSVTIRNVKTGKDMTYKLVSESEADLKNRRISVNSPIGQGLLGKAKGDIAKISTPAGEMDFEIVSISLD
jgi:transcription elongation factor GreA